MSDLVYPLPHPLDIAIIPKKFRRNYFMLCCHPILIYNRGERTRNFYYKQDGHHTGFDLKAKLGTDVWPLFNTRYLYKSEIQEVTIGGNECLPFYTMKYKFESIDKTYDVEVIYKHVKLKPTLLNFLAQSPVSNEFVDQPAFEVKPEPYLCRKNYWTGPHLHVAIKIDGASVNPYYGLAVSLQHNRKYVNIDYVMSDMKRNASVGREYLDRVFLEKIRYV